MARITSDTKFHYGDDAAFGMDGVWPLETCRIADYSSMETFN